MKAVRVIHFVFSSALVVVLASSAWASSGILVRTIDSPVDKNVCPKESRKCLEVALIGDDGKPLAKGLRIQEGAELALQGLPALLVPEGTTLVIESFRTDSRERNTITLKPNAVFKIRTVSDRGESYIVQAGQALFKVSRALMKSLDFFNVSHRDIDAYVRGTEFTVEVQPKKTATFTVSEGKVAVEHPVRIRVEEGGRQESQIRAVEFLEPGKQARFVVRLDIEDYIKTFKTLKDAEDYYRRKLKEDEVSGDPNRTLDGLTTLGFLLADMLGKPTAALSVSLRALQISEERGDTHASIRALNILGVAHKTLGNFDKAIEYLDKALALALRLYPEGMHSDIAAIVLNIGTGYHGLGNDHVAIKYYERSLALELKLYPDGLRLGIAQSLNNLGVAHDELGDYWRAIDYYEKSVALWFKLFPDGVHPGIAITYNNLGNAYAAASLYHKALEFRENALALGLRLYPDGEHASIAEIYNNLGGDYYGLGDYRRALEYYEKSLALILRLYPDAVHQRVAQAYNNLSGAYRSLGDYPNAVEFAERSLALNLRLHPSGVHPAIARNYRQLSLAYMQLGDSAKDSEYSKKAEDVEAKLKAGQ